jgi:hypothetical protein
VDVYATAKAFDTKHPNSSPKMYGDWLAVLQAVGAVCMHAAPATGLVRGGCARQTVPITLAAAAREERPQGKRAALSAMSPGDVVALYTMVAPDLTAAPEAPQPQAVTATLCMSQCVV